MIKLTNFRFAVVKDGDKGVIGVGEDDGNTLRGIRSGLGPFSDDFAKCAFLTHFAYVSP